MSRTPRELSQIAAQIVKAAVLAANRGAPSLGLIHYDCSPDR